MGDDRLGAREDRVALGLELALPRHHGGQRGAHRPADGGEGVDAAQGARERTARDARRRHADAQAMHGWAARCATAARSAAAVPRRGPEAPPGGESDAQPAQHAQATSSRPATQWSYQALTL